MTFAPPVIVCNVVHPENIPIPFLVSVSVPCPKYITVLGRCIVYNEVQPLNAPHIIVVNPSFKVTLDKFEQPWNAPIKAVSPP
jgi:hypothetical protein